MTRDYYAILGVAMDSTPDEIRRAHRALARRHHPDTASDGQGNPELLALIQEAYETLSNPDQRRRYDAKRLADRGDAPSANGATQPPGVGATQTPRGAARRSAPRRPPKAACAACGIPVYTSQLKLYVGRLICHNCYSQKQRRGAQVRLSRGFEMRLRLARVWAQCRFFAAAALLLVVLGAGARYVFVHARQHRSPLPISADQTTSIPTSEPASAPVEMTGDPRSAAEADSAKTQSADITQERARGDVEDEE